MPDLHADDPTSHAPAAPGDQTVSLRRALAEFAHPAVTAFTVLASVALVLGRFFVTTPMWLDEALSVNIASLPLGDLTEALKHDGHPPLYYVLLHGWMNLFGDGNLAVRSMSAVISVATLPLAYLAGRRIGGPRLGLTTVFVVALSPYAFRFGSETRMYSLLMLLAFAGYLLATAALVRPKPLTLVGLAVVAAAGLWTQYWALWLIGTAGVMVLIVAWRAGRADDSQRRRAALLTAGALIAGGLLFTPWLPTMLYQNEHTGTPWAESFRPTGLVFNALTSFAGGAYSEAQLAMLILVVLVVFALFGHANTDSSDTIVLRFNRLQADTVMPATLTLGTIALASAVALYNKMAFAPRYAAVFFPFFALLVALGVNRFRNGATRNVAVASLVLGSIAGVFFVLYQERSQAGVVAEGIESRADSGVVLACPAQLGPSLGRELDTTRFELLSYPILDNPRFVDWVDYAERNAGLDPAAIAQQVLERAGDRPIFVAFGAAFLTFKGQCEQVVGHLATQRPTEQVVAAEPERFYEPIRLVMAAAPAA